MVQQISPNLLAVPVHIEFDRSCGHYTRKTWTKTTEERRPALYPVNGADNVRCVGFRCGERGGERAIGDSIDVGLKSCP